MIFLLGEVAAEVVMMVVMFPLPLPGCPLPGAGFNIVVMIYFLITRHVQNSKIVAD